MTIIRHATLNDLGNIRKLAYEVWPVVYKEIISAGQIEYMLGKGYSITALTEQVMHRGHRFVLVEEDENLLGFASFSEKSEYEKNIFRLHKLYLSINQHGKGLGKMLVSHVAAEAGAAGAAFLELNVNRKNPTVDFYKKMGFSIHKEICEGIGNGYFVDDYIMLLPLTEFNAAHQVKQQ
jgi:ribosomal protein S18 acetylase RimI-like enzyme